jgi:phage terminase small subunit
MARPRTNTETLIARGAYAANPGRFADRHGGGASDDRPVGRAPSYLSELQRECWAEIVKLAPPGALKMADRGLVEIAARVWAKIRASGDQFEARDIARLQSAFAAMGMTPADRSRVKVEKPIEPSGFDALDELN